MKKGALSLSVLIVATLALALAPAPGGLQIDDQPAVATPDSGSCDVQMDAPNAACYPWQPSCSTHKQCDNWCGTPGWGQCIRWCCYCLG
ncbi:MAG: hypothetical protein ACREAA_11150 [Candidatus Polarisedimenticolia bacterium]